jgi:A/G-specific adenine glycosylase
LDKLAAAPLEQVLTNWEGLGYYARARNLHRAAQLVVERWQGHVPRTLEDLRTLPGIGAYTAGAIASIAFGLDAAALDGNLKRVLARLFNIREDVKSAEGEKALRTLAESLVPPGQAGEYNQALMDLGATICTPRAPRCEACPVQSLCEAYRLGVQLERPVSRRRAPIPHRQAAAGVIRKNGRILLVQRPSEKLLGGLWAFPQARRQARESFAAGLVRAVREDLGLEIAVLSETQTQSQTFSHFHLALRVFECQWQSGQASGANCRWVRISALEDYPMGKADRQIAGRLRAERAAGAP